MIDKLGGRKLVGLAFIMFISTIAVYIKGDVPTNYVTILQWAFGLFVAGNMGEHAASAYRESGTTETVDHSADLAELKTTSSVTRDGVQALVSYVSKLNNS